MTPTKLVDNGKCASVRNGRVEKKKSPVKASGRPAKTAETNRQLIPNENLLEVLSYLDRGKLEGVQLTSDLFKTIVEKNPDKLCLRPINEASVSADEEQVHIELKSGALKATVSVELAGQTLNSECPLPHLRNAIVVGRFSVSECRLTPRFLDAFRGIAKNLRIVDPGFLHVREVSPGSDVHRLLDDFASIPAFVHADSFHFGWPHPADEINDALLRSCIARNVPVVNLPRLRCAVTGDAILDWCFASDATNQGVRFLDVATDHISERFLERFVELHESSKHLNRLSLKIAVGRREFALNTDWEVEQSEKALRIRRLMRPITHREDLKGSFVRLEVLHSYHDFSDQTENVLVIRRGVDSPLMDGSFFGSIEQACVADYQDIVDYLQNNGAQSVVRYS